MKGAIFLAVLAAILVAVFFGDRGAVYPVAPDRARQILAKTDLAPVFGSNASSAQIQTNKPTTSRRRVVLMMAGYAPRLRVISV